jgi:hypothetical protein
MQRDVLTGSRPLAEVLIAAGYLLFERLGDCAYLGFGGEPVTLVIATAIGDVRHTGTA